VGGSGAGTGEGGKEKDENVCTNLKDLKFQLSIYRISLLLTSPTESFHPPAPRVADRRTQPFSPTSVVVETASPLQNFSISFFVHNVFKEICSYVFTSKTYAQNL
jgi:hypothetical protein